MVWPMMTASYCDKYFEGFTIDKSIHPFCKLLALKICIGNDMLLHEQTAYGFCCKQTFQSHLTVAIIMQC